MGEKKVEAKTLAWLGGLLIGALVAGIGTTLFGLSTAKAPPRSPASAVTGVLLEAQSARRLALAAVAGEPGAFAALVTANEELGTKTQLLPAGQRQQLVRFRAAIGTIASAGEDVTALRAAGDDLEAIVPRLDGRIDDLQAALAAQRNAAAVAQLERIRTLAEAMQRDARAVLAGVPYAADVTEAMLDADLAVGQIVRGLQDGDPELGLRGVAGPQAPVQLAGLREQSTALSEATRDIVVLADRLYAMRKALTQLDAPLAELQAALPVEPGQVPEAPVWPLAAAAFMGIAIVLFVAIAVGYRRVIRSQHLAAAQTAQNDRNQQAILTLLDEMSSLADGDLTVHATVTEDITGAIADSINYAVEALRELVTTINESAIMVDAAAKQTENTARQLASASEAQSKQFQSASRAIARMATSIDEVSGNAERSSDVARHSVDVAHKGGEAVRRTIEGMSAIRETIQETAKRIKRLGESSQEIGNIVELINDIADQTNILALNAAIQASMAGEAGRGFAVVADEVQRLAERSANATKQIEMLVRAIQSDTNEAIVSMERSTTDVVGGALLAENAGASLEEIEQVSNQIATLVQNISGSAREQAKAAAAVTRSMEALQEINAETAAGTSATTSAISKFAELATQLRRSVAGFRLPPSAAARAEPSEATLTELVPGSRRATPEGSGSRFVKQRSA